MTATADRAPRPDELIRELVEVMAGVDPELVPVIGGWFACGLGWCVRGDTIEQALSEYSVAVQRHAEIASRPHPNPTVASPGGGRPDLDDNPDDDWECEPGTHLRNNPVATTCFYCGTPLDEPVAAGDANREAGR